MDNVRQGGNEEANLTLRSHVGGSDYISPGAKNAHRHNHLMSSFEYNAFVFDVCPMGIIIFNADGDALAANSAAAGITGKSIEELEIENFNNIWKGSEFLSKAQDTLAKNMTCHYDIRLGSDGAKECVWISCRFVPFSFESQKCLLTIFSDISEKKQIEEQNQIYLKQLEFALTQTVAVIRTLGEMRDPYTAGHERRVGELAAAIGAELGLDERRQHGLRIAGYLHDIGKIAAPAEILSKPGRLKPAEFALIQGHAEAGHAILNNVDFPWPVALVALQHHERMDGSGYPHGLKGDEITLKARIVAVADIVEAMSSHRPYRPAVGIDEALAEIERGKGTTLDSNVVDACLRLFREKGYRLSD